MQEQAVVKEKELPLTRTWDKPLSPEDRLLVDLLIERYEGIDGEFKKDETGDEKQGTVTLTIPRLRRIFGSRT